MMNEHAKRFIPAAALTNPHGIDDIFSNLMDFAEWEGARLDEWIDMIAFGETDHPAAIHFRAQEPEAFSIEVSGAYKLVERPNLLLHLSKKILLVNKRSQERLGRSVLSLVLLYDDLDVAAAGVENPDAQAEGIDEMSVPVESVQQIFVPLMIR